MIKYYVIIVNDDNTVYRVYGFDLKRSAQAYATKMADSAFLVCVVSADCMRYSDSDIVKKARKKLKDI